MRVSLHECLLERVAAAVGSTIEEHLFAVYGLQLSSDHLLLLTCVRPQQLAMAALSMPGGLQLLGVVSCCCETSCDHRRQLQLLTDRLPAAAGDDQSDGLIGEWLLSVCLDHRAVALCAATECSQAGASEGVTNLASTVQCQLFKRCQQYQLGSTESLHWRVEGDGQTVPCDVVDAEYISQMVMVIAAPTYLPISCRISPDNLGTAECLQKCVSDKRRYLLNRRLAFYSSSCRLLLRNSGRTASSQGRRGADSWSCVGVSGQLNDEQLSCASALLCKSQRAPTQQQQQQQCEQRQRQLGTVPVDATMSVILLDDELTAAGASSALALHVSAHCHQSGRLRQQLIVSCLGVVGRHRPLYCVAAALESAFHRQMSLYAYSFSLLSAAVGWSDPLLARVCHFWPACLPHPLVWIHCGDSSGSDLRCQSVRSQLHRALLLAQDWPTFRLVNARALAPCFLCTEPDEVASSCPGLADSRAARDLGCSDKTPDSSQMLFNIHIGVPRPNFGSVQVAMVGGDYAYYHYGQQGLEDAGWGCAYRSLQTLCSWFLLQGYVASTDCSLQDSDTTAFFYVKPLSLLSGVPTHRQIQQQLVNIGDKPASFVGSCQWIGSAEVSLCLDSLLGVTSRLIHVPSGAEMTCGAGRQLLHHFSVERTPVMVGGGQLAHTLLGVAYDALSGHCQYLVLDPHYAGHDTDPRKIQRRGWCGWKSDQFWQSSAFYNLCMPLRPRSH